MAEMLSLVFDGLLFDMDGTLVDSTAGISGAWDLFRKDHPDIQIFPEHGLRTQDSLQKYLPHFTDAQIKADSERYELEIIRVGERKVAMGLVESAIPPCRGVSTIVSVLQDPNACDNWAVCTSSTRAYALQALALAGVPTPRILVDSYDVSRGKPAPDPYLLGANRLRVEPSQCLVFEDAPAGILSGKAAGCKVLAVLTSTPRTAVQDAKPDFIVEDFSQINISRVGDHWEVTVPASSALSP